MHIARVPFFTERIFTMRCGPAEHMNGESHHGHTRPHELLPCRDVPLHQDTPRPATSAYQRRRRRRRSSVRPQNQWLPRPVEEERRGLRFRRRRYRRRHTPPPPGRRRKGITIQDRGLTTQRLPRAHTPARRCLDPGFAGASPSPARRERAGVRARHRASYAGAAAATGLGCSTFANRIPTKYRKNSGAATSVWLNGSGVGVMIADIMKMIRIA